LQVQLDRAMTSVLTIRWLTYTQVGTTAMTTTPVQLRQQLQVRIVCAVIGTWCVDVTGVYVGRGDPTTRAGAGEAA